MWMRERAYNAVLLAKSEMLRTLVIYTYNTQSSTRFAFHETPVWVSRHRRPSSSYLLTTLANTQYLSSCVSATVQYIYSIPFETLACARITAVYTIV